MPETRQAVEPYKLSAVFATIFEFDGNTIFLNTFIFFVMSDISRQHKIR